jgi:hypothetical protein
MAHQSNGFTARFSIVQNGGDLTGSANHGPDQDGHFTRSMEARGTVTDTEFLWTISWDNGTRGRYSGRFESDGRIAGVSVDLEHPTSQATWISDRSFGMSG